MNENKNKISIRITKSEYELICSIDDLDLNLFTSTQINDNEYILLFDDRIKVYEFDELIKDKLLYDGFDRNYNINVFGQMFENMIDKIYNKLSNNNE